MTGRIAKPIVIGLREQNRTEIAATVTICYLAALTYQCHAQLKCMVFILIVYANE